MVTVSPTTKGPVAGSMFWLNGGAGHGVFITKNSKYLENGFQRADPCVISDCQSDILFILIRTRKNYICVQHMEELFFYVHIYMYF